MSITAEFKHLSTALLNYGSHEVLDAFADISEDIVYAVNYWRLLAEAYTRADFTGRFENCEKRDLFNAGMHGRHRLMTTRQRNFVKRLPETVTIHRAMSVEEQASGWRGISWTLDIKVAEFFRDTYRRHGKFQSYTRVIETRVINKTDIVAYFDNRKESEVIVIFEPQNFYE